MLTTTWFDLNTVDKNKWSDFILKEGNIFSTLEFLESVLTIGGMTPLLICLQEGPEILGACILLYYKVYTNRFMEIMGILGQPVIKKDAPDPKGIVKLLFSKIEEEARKRNSLFIQWAFPEWLVCWSQWSDCVSLVQQGYHVNQVNGWILDIDRDLTDIFKNMSSSHKRWIHYAREKHDIEVSESKDVESFYSLWKETFKRANRKPPLDLEFIKKMYHVLGHKKIARIYYAAKGDQLLCSNFMLYWGKTAYFLFGGSISGERYGAPHALHWNLIKNAKNEGYQFYHFGGSWRHYRDKAIENRIRAIDEFKRRFGVKPKEFYWGRKSLVPRRSNLIDFFFKRSRHE